MTDILPDDGSLPNDGGPSPEQSTRKTRTRTGCLNCRRRRRKCDEHRPECRGCRQREEACEWGLKITFKQNNANSLGVEHPSMQESSRKRPRRFKILDVTSQIEKGYEVDSSATMSSGDRSMPHTSTVSPESLGNGHGLNGVRCQSQISPREEGSSRHSACDTPNSITTTLSDHTANVGYGASSDHALCVEGGSVSGATHTSYSNTQRLPDGITPESVTSSGGVPGFSSPGSIIHTEDAAAELLALRYLPTQTRTQSLFESPLIRDDMVFSMDVGDPQMENSGELLISSQIFDNRDGIFIPGSAYQELHSTLRDHLIYTARSNAATRAGTPDQPDAIIRTMQQSIDGSDGRIDSDPESTRSSRPVEISPQREFILWKTWIDEVAPWLDKFDNSRHFEHKIPVMAKTVPHLKYSVLALCARQIEQKESSPSSSESLGLYQEAIHLLLPELHSRNTSIIASCVILCVLEMLSCSPKEWRRHLEGCANLLQAVGINGFVGGVEEALFWCFARMDLCGALISQDITLIPVQTWASNIDLKSDVGLFRSSSHRFDTYANYAVFLCASCVAYLHSYRNRDRHRGAEGDWCTDWNVLVGHLEDWHAKRSEEMKPLLSIQASESEGNSPFPTVLYGNGSAVSGNQLYHTATLLMLQEKPNGLVMNKKQKSIFWHARQICAISESNTHHGAWTNSVQPLWIAGKVMSHPSEHRAILNILERIEKDTGWLTGWRREDLKSWWGDSDD